MARIHRGRAPNEAILSLKLFEVGVLMESLSDEIAILKGGAVSRRPAPEREQTARDIYQTLRAALPELTALTELIELRQ